MKIASNIQMRRSILIMEIRYTVRKLCRNLAVFSLRPNEFEKDDYPTSITAFTSIVLRSWTSCSVVPKTIKYEKNDLATYTHVHSTRICKWNLCGLKFSSLFIRVFIFSSSHSIGQEENIPLSQV